MKTKRLRTALAVFGVTLLTAHVAPANAALIEIWQTGGGIGSLAATDAIIAGGAATTTLNYGGLIDFDDLGDGTRGNFGLNLAWPGGHIDSFAVRITGVLSLLAPTRIGLNHDDGARLKVNGAVVASGDGVVDNRNSITAGDFGIGSYNVEITYFENFGGASLEFAKYDSSGSATGLLAMANPIPEPATLGLFGLGLAGLGIASRRRKTA